MAYSLACAPLAAEAFLKFNLMSLDVPIDNRRLPSDLLVNSQMYLMIFRLADHLRSAFQEELILLLGDLFLPLINRLENEGFEGGDAEALGQFRHPLFLHPLKQAGRGGLKDGRSPDELFPI